MTPTSPSATEALLRDLLSKRILVLDGAMGTMIQQYKLTEEDYRGGPQGRFIGFTGDGSAAGDKPRRELFVRGNNELLSLTQPQIISEIHEQYLAAGADLIETNTFGATSIAQDDYQMAHLVYEMNLASARLARAACDKYSTPEQPRFVAGALGPTPKTASISPDVNDPAARNVSFMQLVDAYLEQTRALVEGGVDVLLVETVFDTLNCKAALFAIDSFFEESGKKLPIMISGTVTDASGRILSGQTVEAFWNSVRHARPLTIGLNCALGAALMRPYAEELSKIADTFVCIYPNAGLPNPMSDTGFDETPDVTSSLLKEFADSGFVNIAGGCCGTTPAHIRAIAEVVRSIAPRVVPEIPRALRLSGLEPFTVDDASLFVNVGERTNVTGSKAFARLILGEKYDEALAVARQQVENGAQMIDINMDEGMLDAVAAMTRFLNLIAGEPDIARVPIMIDSSKFAVLEAGLRCIQGKPVVNSISMKEGEEEFLRQAKLCRRYGAAIIVMAFDEQGQADTFQRKTEISKRAYDLLVNEVDFPPEDIIFDPNIFAIATGIEEHNNYAVDFIQATRWIRENLPHAKVSGGVSNVSFSFRGNDPAREAIQTVFLYHAIQAGLTMGIVNAGMMGVYSELAPELRERVEDVVLNRRPDATERLVEFAATLKAGDKKQEESLEWRAGSVQERLAHALVHGITQWVVEDTEEARQQLHGGRRAADPGDRRAADGWHEHRRRPVRPGQDVPAAGGEIGARDEAGGGAPDSVHRAGKIAEPGSDRRRRQAEGQAGGRHGERRRARHRQEHRRRGPAMQQLRSGEHGRDGAVLRNPGQGEGRERRHGRPVGTDHAVAGGNGARRARNGARPVFPRAENPALDRRRHHQPRAHRGQDRSELQRPGGVRVGRLALGLGGAVAVDAGKQRAVHRRSGRRLRAGARPARQQEGAADAVAGRRPPEQDAARIYRRARADQAEIHRPPRVQEPRPGDHRRIHRLGPAVPDLGFGRQVSGDPARPGGRRNREQGVRRSAGAAEAGDRRPLADRQRRHHAACRPTASTTTTSRSTPTSRAAKSC